MAFWVKFTYKFHIILFLCDINFHKKQLDNRKKLVFSFLFFWYMFSDNTEGKNAIHVCFIKGT